VSGPLFQQFCGIHALAERDAPVPEGVISVHDASHIVPGYLSMDGLADRLIICYAAAQAIFVIPSRSAA
jgi:hypothetical protein